jgi:hypothetical protein
VKDFLTKNVKIWNLPSSIEQTDKTLTNGFKFNLPPSGIKSNHIIVTYLDNFERV